MASSLDRRKCILARVTSVCSFLLFMMAAVPAGADKTAADYFVKSLPGAPEEPQLKMHAGHIEVAHEHNANLFFWHYSNRHIANRRRTVIWINGGPGCSSEDGALMEIGPYRVREGGNLELNNGSWDEFANLLFVDNPVGTGFSYVDGDSYLHELKEMSDHFTIFLEKWFDIFPEFVQDDIYLAGESYAGQHIPYIAQAIIDRNKATSKEKWNLSGLLIGNGWISPPHHYESYPKFMYDQGLIQGGTSKADQVDRALANCLKVLEKPEAKDMISINACENVLSVILSVTKDSEGCVNMYDVRLRDSYPSCGMNWPPDLHEVTPYLRRDDVVKALHVNKEKRIGWSECSGAVSSNFRALKSKPSVQMLPSLLESGLRILLFSGAKDLIVNHLGTESMISDMTWSDGTGFETSPGVYAPKQDWVFEDEVAGYYQEARNLTYVLINNSSHMVPFDYPRRTRDMLDRFMNVDIASIGGTPVDSEIGGEKVGPETSVGGHPNSTVAQEEGKKKVHQAELKAYYRSGEAALLVVLFIALFFGWWVWRGRRQQKRAQEGQLGSYAPLPIVNGKRGDVEAQDFDENELQNLANVPVRQKEFRDDDEDMQRDRYDVGSDSDSDSDEDVGRSGKKERM